jgi:hypothetical protein
MSDIDVANVGCLKRDPIEPQYRDVVAGPCRNQVVSGVHRVWNMACAEFRVFEQVMAVS